MRISILFLIISFLVNHEIFSQWDSLNNLCSGKTLTKASDPGNGNEIFYDSNFLNATVGWVISNADSRKRLNSVCIPNENYIYVSGDSILLDPQQFPNVSFMLISSDGGNSWQRSTNFAGGSLLIFKDHSPTEIYSATWQRTSKISASSYINSMGIGEISFLVSFTAPGTFEYVNTFDYVEPNTTYASSYQRILKRTGKGNFNTIPSNITNTKSVSFINPNTGYITTGYIPTLGYDFYKTTNGGFDWTYINSTNASKLYFYDEYFGFKLSNRMIYKTTDGGISWIVSDPVNYFNDFYFFNKDIGYVCGSNGIIKKTVDGGTNWIIQTTPITINLNAISFYNSDFGVAVGDSGKILITTIGGVGVNQTGTLGPKAYQLYQNYPNPFNPVTKIKFDVSQSSFVKLLIFDILGIKVTELVNEKLNSGEYEVSFDASEYQSGVYFCKLETESFSQTRKMLLIK
ncbi:MAG: T9SS type A sorting domain-containing protein [bacterium]